jgi:hypothetical protein
MTIKALYPTINPTLNLDFANTKTLGPLVTFTRASSATFIDSAGTLQTAAVDVPRFDHNPTTGESLGLLVEEQRTNSIRNNTMVGAVAGTPGTSPTNWSLGFLSGLTQTIVGTGTESGIAYIDIRIFGTTSSALFWGVAPEGATVVAANPNSIWTSTFYVRLVGGSLTNVTGVKNVLTNFNSSGAALNQFAVALLTPTSAALATQRYSNSTTSATFADATTAFVRNFLQIEANSGVAIDITLRIGLPQLEQGAFATSVIPTSTAAATRSADVASITGANFSSWYRQDEGTWLGQYAPIYNASATVPSGTPHLLQVYTTASANNSYSIRGAGTSTSQETFGRNPTVGLVFASNSGVGFGVAGLLRKVAMGIDSAFIAATTNNSAISAPANTVAALMAAHDILTIGTGTTGGSPQQVNSHIRRLTFWPQRLSNSTLQAITQ